MSLFGLGKGITITTGFDVASQIPLDARTVVDDLTALRAIPASVIHLGLTVFVVSENKTYQWKSNKNEDGSSTIGWGLVESEVSTKAVSLLSEINFSNTPSLMLQKNKSNFFPIVNENYVYDNNRVSIPNKYQPKTDNALKTTSKTVPGAINELNTKMADSIRKFEQDIDSTLDELDKEVTQMKSETQKTLDDLEKEINTTMAGMQTNMQNKMNQMDTTFNNKMKEIDNKIASLEDDIAEDVAKITGNVSNVILTTAQLDDFMKQIQANQTALNNV